MELLTGAPLLLQQYTALLKKNSILTWRNRRSTAVQLFSSFVFMLLIFGIDKAIRYRLAAASSLTDPPAQSSFPIPPCEDKFFIRTPCIDFAYSGNASARVSRIVASIMRNNPGREIAPERVRGFTTPDEVDAWLFADPMRCPGALHFVDAGGTVIRYGIQTNSTAVPKRGNFEDPTFKFQVPLQMAAEREIARSLLGDPNFSWVVALKQFARPATATFSVVVQAGPIFFLSIAMFGFVFQISSLVAEKELKLRQAMSIMGLYESAYWLSWLTWEALLTFVAALITILFGMMFHFDFFLHNSFAVLFLVFFLFQLNMLGFAFMISTFVSKSSSASTVGFAVFIVGFMTQGVQGSGFPYDGSYANYKRVLWSLFPPNLFAQALKLLGNATSTSDAQGISWSRRGECDVDDCVLTIESIFKWLISTFFLWFILAIYFDNIIPNANGVRKPILYFLNPSYWTGNGGNTGEESSPCSCLGSTPPPLEDAPPDDEDVLAEETAVRQSSTQSELDPSIAAQVRGLQKAYPGALTIGCCKCSRTKPYHAVKGIWVNLAKDQLFCLLGPNGAGKTTAISCLTGLTPITGGDALIYGNSIRSSVGMSNIRKIIGVCPQFDILWDALTAEEHMNLFARIKGLPPSTIKSVSERSLAEVKLTNAAGVRAGSCSGGMKRRLSVAIALMGDPKVVFLDEPTTGMDPITRRHVWDIIEDAKKGRAIVLTTHSMEEADILGDRIAIMAKGKLRCIGTSVRLKSKFGAGYVANVSFTADRHTNNTQVEPVKQFFKYHLDIEPKEENKTFLTFVIPHKKESLLTNFFAELQDREKEFGISDIQLGLTTLEEVFLNIAKQAELESSASEGSLVTLDLQSGVSIQIPKGASFIGIPGTESEENPNGLMVEVFWNQDDTGNLTISGHSPETPIPRHVQKMVPAVDIRTVRGKDAPAVGFVIDPKQISMRQ